MKEDKDRWSGASEDRQVGRKRNKSAEQRRGEKRRRLGSRASRERVIDQERKLTAQASRHPTRSGSRREDDRRRSGRDDDGEQGATRRSGSSRERRQKKERRHSRSRSRDRQRRRSSSRDMKRDDRKDSAGLRRGYILYPATSRKHIGFNLSPRSHAIKAAEMEYQNKRLRKKSPRNRSPHNVKVEKYEPTSKLSYLPRETLEDRERRKNEMKAVVPIKLLSTPIQQIDPNQSIPGVSAKYLQNSSTGQTYRTKIFLPKFQGINYVGLIIGPKGIYQKKLEDKTACKILIRGKGSHKDGHPMSQSDQDDQHVLIIGNTEDSVAQAKKIVEKVLTADESQRNQIRSEQLKDAQELSKDLYRHDIEDFMLTPYGPPSPYAVIIAIPNECVGLIIGKGGETIRHLQVRSGCKIQVAKKEIPSNMQNRLASKGHPIAKQNKSYHHMRYVFIEGQDRDKYEPARQLIQKIIEDHKLIQENFAKGGETNPFPGPHTTYFIPDIATDMLIGADGKILRQIYQRTNCYIFVSAEVNGSNERMLQFSGGTGPSVQHLLQQGKHKQVQDFYRPPEEELEPFSLTPAEYLSLQSVEKCKLEIRIRLRKLEQFALKHELQLCTETVLKFLREEMNEQFVVGDSPCEQNAKMADDAAEATATTKTGNGKQKLVETARMEEELLNGADCNSFLGFASMNSNTFQSLGSALIKTEPCTSAASTSPGSVVKPSVVKSINQGGVGFELSIHQESQKDFLFDPYAAAYYERFVGFVPGAKVLRFEDLKWPALQDNDRYSQAQLKSTYFQAYQAIYGDCEQQAGASIVKSIRDVVMENKEESTAAEVVAAKPLPSPLQSFQSFHQSFNAAKTNHVQQPAPIQQQMVQDEQNGQKPQVAEPSNLKKLFMRCFGDAIQSKEQAQQKQIGLKDMLQSVDQSTAAVQAEQDVVQLEPKTVDDKDAQPNNSQESAVSMRSLQKLQKFSKIIRKCKRSDDRGEKLRYLERLRQSSDRESRREDGCQAIMQELGNVAKQIMLEESAAMSCVSLSHDGCVADSAQKAQSQRKGVHNLDPLHGHKPVTPSRGRQSQRSISSKACSPPPVLSETRKLLVDGVGRRAMGFNDQAFELDINNQSEMNSSNKNASIYGQQRAASDVRSRSNSELTLRERQQIEQHQRHLQQRMMMAGPPQPMHPFMFQAFIPPPPGLLGMPPLPQFTANAGTAAGHHQSRNHMAFMPPVPNRAINQNPQLPISSLSQQLEQLTNEQIDRLLDQVNEVIAREQSQLEKSLQTK